jgi:hypothetical protein
MAGFEEYAREANRAEIEQAQIDREWREQIARRVSEMAQYLLQQEVAPLPIFVSSPFSELQTSNIKTGWFRSEKKHIYVFDHKRLPHDGWIIKPYCPDEINHANILTTDGLVLNARTPGIVTSAAEQIPKITVFPAISCSGVKVEDFFLPGMINNAEPGGFSDRVRLLANDGDQLTYMQRPEWKYY